MRLHLSVAVLAAVALAVAAAPAEAASKKKGGKAKAAKVTVSKSGGGYWAGNHHACSSWGSRAWYPVAAVGAVGCSVFYAVPVMVEGFWIPRSSKA